MNDTLGKVLISMWLWPLNAIVRGYAISWMWLWFIVPIWNWQPLTVSQAIGVSFVLAALTARISTRKLKDDEKFSSVELALLPLIANLMMIGIAWILHQFI